MSSSYHKKLRLIRKAEGLTQAAMASETGISLSSIRNYESGGQVVGLTIIERVIGLPKFMKYTLWLMTDQTAPEAGQIAPKGAEELISEGDIATAAIKQPR
ncbi:MULTISPECIES: helix-turn-helix domain-containing protein [Erwinia]|uniref:helix-turn-helix domain-containing protein n=1 Tax=Erwinia TaxID=551 RepID=UPI00105D3788|nr:MULTISPECIES: helix-turn-helix transcriptional regulator [Erwinia]MBD8169552.1 helix-turn-helix transcriptional regulator [Erwinia persicina]NKG32801.1 helix-turn-helix transcriptional regulator [Erwinia rhapontici]TDS93441.1 helix-turn-helix protein [Erwinia rhapontici]